LQSLQAMEEFVHTCVGQLLSQMESHAKQGKPIDLAKFSHFFAFDTIGELAFSKGFGMLQSGKEDERIPLIANQMELGTITGMMPSILIPLSRNFACLPIPWMQRQVAGREKLKTLTQTRLEDRQHHASDRKDILGRLLEAQDSETGETLDAIDLRTEAFSSIVAGSDSTSAGLAFTFYHILTHPKVKQQLVQELRSAFPNRVKNGMSSMPKMAELNRLPYLLACIKESLRLTPPQTMNLPRYVPSGGREIAGVFFPEGTIVGIASKPIHLQTDLFGPDADVYSPERWIYGSGERKADSMGPYFMTFGIGSRQCIGRNIAMMELVKLVGTTFLWYDLELKSGSPDTKSLFFTRMVDPLLVTVSIPS